MQGERIVDKDAIVGLEEINLSNYLPLRDLVYNNVRTAILSGSFEPGKRLMEVELAEMLGVSRTPVREALRKLEMEGFIDILPRKGAVVKVISVKDIQDLLEIRASLDELATRIACQKMTASNKKELKEVGDEFNKAVSNNDINAVVQNDIKFHDIIFASTQNEKLIQIINNLKEQIYRYRVLYIRDKSYLRNIVKEHDEIIFSIIEGDTKRAGEAAVIHIQNQESALIKALNLQNK